MKIIVVAWKAKHLRSLPVSKSDLQCAVVIILSSGCAAIGGTEIDADLSISPSRSDQHQGGDTSLIHLIGVATEADCAWLRTIIIEDPNDGGQLSPQADATARVRQGGIDRFIRLILVIVNNGDRNSFHSFAIGKAHCDWSVSIIWPSSCCSIR